MHTWTIIATAIGGLLNLTTAAINLAAALSSKRRKPREPHH